MKLCLICSEYPPAPHGGIGPVTRQLATGLVRLGHAVEVVGLYDLPKDAVELIDGVTVHRLARVGHGLWGELRSRLKLTRYLEQLQRRMCFDLLEAPEWRGDTAFLKADVPVVLRLHTSHVVDRMVTGSTRPGRLLRYFENRALCRADRVCTVSSDIAKKTAEAFPAFGQRMLREEVPVILNAIELQTFRPALEPRRKNLLAFAGSLKPKKGIENLLLAFDLVQQRTACRLALAGSDTRTIDGESYLEACLDRISAEGRARVDVLGRRSREEIASLFCRATVVVLPSLQEACPMVVMEAMACGAPIIFGACGPHAEIIEEGVDGLTCDPRSPADIAKKTLQLLTDPVQAARLGAAARLRAERDFAEERFLQQSLDFYVETISRYGQGRG